MKIVKSFCINSENEIDVSFLPPLVRRRLSLLDKAVLTTMNKVYDEEVEEIVFSSEWGEFARLDKLIEQYQTLDEVSPAQFSASVHNFPVSFFTMNKKLNIPYHALSAGKDSFQAGFIKSIISKKRVLYTYADVFEGIKSVSYIIEPNGNIFCG